MKIDKIENSRTKMRSDGSVKENLQWSFQAYCNKNEELINAEDTFLTEDFSQMLIEEGFNTEQECNPFRLTNSQPVYDQELDTY